VKEVCGSKEIVSTLNIIQFETNRDHVYYEPLEQIEKNHDENCSSHTTTSHKEIAIDMATQNSGKFQSLRHLKNHIRNSFSLEKETNELVTRQIKTCVYMPRNNLSSHQVVDKNDITETKAYLDEIDMDTHSKFQSLRNLKNNIRNRYALDKETKSCVSMVGIPAQNHRNSNQSKTHMRKKNKTTNEIDLCQMKQQKALGKSSFVLHT
jgi:hypothetical protein